MKAAHKNKVEKVVITSSIAAVYKTGNENQKEFGEKDWTNPDLPGLSYYVKSKTLAEKAAWDFIDSLPEEEKFPLVTINPGFIIGPNLNEANFSSGDVFKKILLGEFPGLPYVQMPTVDVRDCAEAHLNAILRDEANGHRFIMCSQDIWMNELGQILHDGYANNGYPKCRNNIIWKPLLWLASWFDGEASTMYKMWGNESKMNAELSLIHI